MKEGLFRPKILQRERINRLLEAIFETPLFYLSASMGYGKTTAIRCFLETKKEVNVIWVPVSTMEGDEELLWHQFGYAMKKYSPEFAKQLLSIGFPKSDYEIRQVLDVIQEVMKGPMVMVFDDYQESKGQQLLDRILSIYTEYNMKNIHVVVISRMRPPAQFLMLNIKNRCMLMWQGELAFTKEETDELFKLNGFTLDKDQLDELYRYTIGWVAPTYLSLLEYAINRNIGVIVESTELVKVAVFDQLDEESQRILLQLAPIEKFSIELAEYVTRNKKVNEVLKEMLLNNCFINLIPQSREYQFHTLFKYTLLEEIRKTDINEKEILNRCATWYKTKGNIMTAIDYFYRAENYEAILDIMSQTGATEYVDVAPKLMVRIFNQMSLEQKLSKPIGYLTFIQSYMLSNMDKEAGRMLEEAKEYYLKHPEIEHWKHIMGEIYLIETYMSFGKLDKMLEKVMKAYECLDDGRSLILGPNMVCTRGNIYTLSLFYSTIGEYKQVKDFLLDNLRYFKHMGNGCTAGMRYLVQAEYAYDTGELEQAKMFAYKAIYKAETKQQTCIILNAYFVLMRISFIKGNLDEIDGYVEEIEKRIIGRIHPMVRSSIEMIKAYIYGVSKQYGKLPEWSKNFDMQKGILGLPKFVVAPINIGFVLLYKKEYVQLEVFMEACLEEFKKEKRLYPMIQAYILSAIAKLELYDEDEAIESLSEAVHIAERDQIIMPFIEYGQEITSLLEIMAKESSFVERILEYYKGISKGEPKGKATKQVVQDILTDREKEVMRLFVRGYKQSEVAKELQITVDTVKRHIKNVYSKLNIHSKADLIEKLGQDI